MFSMQNSRADFERIQRKSGFSANGFVEQRKITIMENVLEREGVTRMNPRRWNFLEGSFDDFQTKRVFRPPSISNDRKVIDGTIKNISM